MKSYREKIHKAYTGIWKKPENEVVSDVSNPPEVEIFPYKDDLSETKTRKKKIDRKKRNEKININ